MCVFHCPNSTTSPTIPNTTAFSGARPMARATQLITIHGKLYGFKKNRSCPASAISEPTRAILRFPNLRISGVQAKMPATSVSVSVRKRALYIHVSFPNMYLQ